MAVEIAKAYVQVVPSTKGIKGTLTKELGGEADSAGKSAGASLGSGLVGALKGVLAAAGIGAIVKSALDAGGNLQQSFGGLETIYGDAADAAKEYAAEASKAGISMNDYAEQAVSFGASLKQAFEGDTAKAVEAANTAILDMADNAAKMGTPLESIQNAYQGFAKQNYTMLDNLKLGYGGTKSEMERLLKDAQAFSGVEYDINNLGDVYDAIHVIQGELGLTGVAAAEASETLTGSMGAVKASFENVLATLTTGGDISAAFQSLSDSLFAFVFNNLLPMLGNIFESIPDLLEGALSIAIRALSKVDVSEVFSSVLNVIKRIAVIIVENIPYVVEAFVNMAIQLGKSLASFDWLGFAKDTIASLKGSLSNSAGEILGTDSFISPTLVNAIKDKLPTILQTGKDMLRKLVDGIIDNLPELAKGVFAMITKFVATVGENLPSILESGIKLLGEFIAGIIKTIPKLVEAIPKIITSIVECFEEYDWKEIGINILKGIAEGIKSAVSTVVDAVKGAVKETVNTAKEALGIHSPSRVARDQIGTQFAAGMALGIEDGAKGITDAVKSVTDGALLNGSNIMGVASYNRYSNTGSQYNDIAQALSKDTNVIVTLQGDAGRLFTMVQDRAKQYTMQTGRNAFA